MKNIGRKAIVGFKLLTAVGVETIVCGALMLAVPAKSGVIKSMAIGVAGFVLSCMAVDGATSYIDEQLDEIASAITVKKQELKEKITKGVEA